MSETPQRVEPPDYLKEILDRYEGKTGDFHEYELSGALKKAADARKPRSKDDWRAYVAEGGAFFFDHSQPGESSEWGTHFGPVTSIHYKDGTTVHSPDVGAIDAGIIRYWEQRRDETRHPVMKARYADLLWDFRKRITGDRAHVEDARAGIDAYVQAIENAEPESAVDNIHRLERALELAVSISDHNRIESVRDAMFRLFERIVDASAHGTWPWLFDSLYGHKKVSLTDEQQNRLISTLEDILTKCSTRTETGGLDPWGAEEAALRLARHYRKKGREDEVKRVVLTYGKAYEQLASEAAGIVAIGWLQKVYDAYRAAGLRDQAEKLLLLYKKKGEEAESRMASIQVEVPINKKAVEAALDELTAGTLDDTLTKIAQSFVPRGGEAEGIVKRIAEDGSIMSQLGITVLGEQQIVAEIGSVQSDLEGRVVYQLGQTIDITWRFLALAINAARERRSLDGDELMAFIMKSPVFDPQRVALICQGVEAYFANDHVKAVHVLVPQIEHALRTLLALLGQPTSRRARSRKAVMQEKTLTDILEFEPAIQAFLPKDVVLYLRVLFTDPRGHNVRNLLAHGLMPAEAFNRQISDWIIHVLLLLGLLRSEISDDPAGRVP